MFHNGAYSPISEGATFDDTPIQIFSARSEHRVLRNILSLIRRSYIAHWGESRDPFRVSSVLADA